jgi:hypothetical protein
MQVINRIQNAIINVNAAIQGALVVVGANAHRVYPSFTPCDQSPVSKCPGKWSSSSTTSTTRSLERLELELEGRERLTSGPVGRTWRRNRHHDQMPATMWAMFVLNRQMCS